MRRALWVGAWIVVASAYVTLQTEREARACGGCFVPPPPPPPPMAPPQSVDSVITAERMIFSISKKQSTLYDEITYSGSPASFAWVLPIKGEVEVGLSSDILFASIDQLTATTVTAPTPDCPPPPVCSAPSSGGEVGFGCGSVSIGTAYTFPASLGLPASCSGDSYIVETGDNCGCTGTYYVVCSGGTYSSCDCDIPSGYTLYGAGGDGGNDGGNPVTITANQQVGPYEMVQLHSKDGSALTGWLTSHGYEIPKADRAVIDSYVAAGMDFLALKLVPGEGVNSMQPVRVTTKGAFPVLPLRMVGVGTGATTGITLWIVADGRWEPQNFPFFTLSSSELTWDWNDERSNFEELRLSKEAQLHGAGWQIESSIELSENTITNTVLTAVQDDPSASYTAYDGGGSDGAGPDAGDAGASDAIAGDAGEAGTSRDAGEPSDGGAPDSGTDEAGSGASELAHQDLAVLFDGISGSNARVTRLRSDIAHSALSKDLVIKASADQAELSNTYETTKQKGQPLCPVYDDNCAQTGKAPRDQAEADANGGCRTTAGRSPMGSRTCLVILGVLAGLGVVRTRRRRRRSS
jgi:hypothetical protein